MSSSRFSVGIVRAAGLAALAAWSFAVPAQAAPIIGTSGALVEVSAPTDVSTGATESDAQIIIFFESTQVLASDLVTDAGVIAAGTTVDSYLIHFDKVGGAPGSRLQGSVTFGGTILGVDRVSATLDLRDATFGAPGTTYATGEFSRGIELGPLPTGDGIMRSGAFVSVNLFTDNWVDDMRLYVAVPEPSLLVLVGVSLAPAAVARLRRRPAGRRP